MTSLQDSGSLRIASATTAEQWGVESQDHHPRSARGGRRTLPNYGRLSHILLKDERDGGKHTRIIVRHDLQKQALIR
jgi:hypothetical protein